MQYFVTLAQDIDRMNRGVRLVQWGTTGVGVVILIAAAALLFQKPKPQTSAATARIQKIVGAILAVIGLGVVVYAWVAHSTF